MPRIFVSYRRADSKTITGRIYDRLSQSFGKDSMFKDVDDIEFGDFRSAISEAIVKTDVMIIVIGQQWLTAYTETDLGALADNWLEGNFGLQVKDGWLYIDNEKFFVKGIGIDRLRPGQSPWFYLDPWRGG